MRVPRPQFGAAVTFLNGHLASRFQVVAVERSTPDKCEQLPGTLDTLQRLWSTVVQGDVRAYDQVPYRPGGKDLTRSSRRHHPGRDVDGDAADIAIAQLDLTGVQPRSDLEPDAAQLVSEGGRAAHRPPRAVEGGQDPVPGRLDQLAAGLLDRLPGQL